MLLSTSLFHSSNPLNKGLSHIVESLCVKGEANAPANIPNPPRIVVPARFTPFNIPLAALSQLDCPQA